MGRTDFRFYKKGEIKKYWEKYEIFTSESLKLNKFFHIVRVDDIDEAEVIAAVFMRDVGATMDSTSYDDDKKLLYLNFGNTMMPTVNRDVTARMVKHLLKETCIKAVKKDGLGQILFAEDFALTDRFHGY